MNTKCKYIIELEKKLNEKNKIFKILIGIVVITFLLLLHIDGIKGLFLDSNGGFSNEIFWSAVSGIGSIVAFAGVIYTIWYTEKTRRIQNEYEYKKQQLLEKQGKFSEQVLNTLVEIDPVKFIEVIAHADVNNFLKVGQELTIYMASLRKVEYQLYWYYKKSVNETPRLTEFLKELNNIILLIEECILEYSGKITPVYCDFIEKNNLLNIMSQRSLSDDEVLKLSLIKSKYQQEDLYAEITQRTTVVSGKIIEYKNKKWNDFVELGKEVVDERENIVEEVLKNM